MNDQDGARDPQTEPTEPYELLYMVALIGLALGMLGFVMAGETRTVGPISWTLEQGKQIAYFGIGLFAVGMIAGGLSGGWEAQLER